MNKPCVIAINAVSGGGKTSLARLLGESLVPSKVFHFDDFDSTNVYPDDLHEWTSRGADLSEFDCPGMREAVTAEIARNLVKYIILDYPFGRDHHRFADLIDLSVFVDTPLDVAMARRIIRDFLNDKGSDPQDTLDRLRHDLTHYVTRARHPYLDTFRHRETSDLILDGWQPLEVLRNQIIERIQ